MESTYGRTPSFPPARSSNVVRRESCRGITVLAWLRPRRPSTASLGGRPDATEGGAIVEHGEEVDMAGRREVRRSTQKYARRCLYLPLSAGRCLGGLAETDRICPDSRAYGLESAIYGQSSAGHGALLRNEGAVGSNPITSTHGTPRSPRYGAFLLSTVRSAFEGVHRSTHFGVALQIWEPKAKGAGPYRPGHVHPDRHHEGRARRRRLDGAPATGDRGPRGRRPGHPHLFRDRCRHGPGRFPDLLGGSPTEVELVV
jgi:hypothetical protein